MNPPRRRGQPVRYVSARVFADQLGLSLTRIAQLIEDPDASFPAPAAVSETPEGETYGWDPAATRSYHAYRQQHPPRAGRPRTPDQHRPGGSPDDPAV